MKTFAWSRRLMTIAALVAGATFAGCTDDENDNKKYDEDGNEIVDEPGNTPGGDMELKEKRVARIWHADADENGTLYYKSGLEFMYKDNRIAKITNYQCKEDGTVIDDEYPRSYRIDYSATQVTMYYEDGTTVQSFDLEDGRAVAGEAPGDEEVYAYEYTDGYLTRLTRTYAFDGEEYTERIHFQVEDGLWTEAAITDNDGEGTMTFEMSDVENNLSVDLYIFCHFFVDNGNDCLLGLIGNRMKYLPEQIETEYEGTTATEEFQYQLDDEGYVTEVVCRVYNPLGDAGYENYTQVWQIEYE